MLFSQFTGSGRIIFDSLKEDCVILENIRHSSGLGLVHNSGSAVAIVNHSSRALIETTGKARGPLFLENSGSNPKLKINGDGILLWVRQWNREYQHVDLSSCTAWVFGDNVECKPRGDRGRNKGDYVSPHYTVRNSLLEFIGCHDLQGFDHPASDPPIFTLIDSDASILAAGSIRSGEKEHGHVANIIKDVKSGKEHTIGWTDRNVLITKENHQKFLIPLYASRSTAIARHPSHKLAVSPLVWQAPKASDVIVARDGQVSIPAGAFAPDIARAVVNRACLAFTFEPSNQFPSLSHLRFKARLQGSQSPSPSIFLQSSVNGFGTYHSIAKIDLTPDSFWHTYDFPLGPQFKPVPDPAVEFRLYLTAASAHPDQLLLDNLELLGGD
jgi:hypothetical protein